MKSQDFSTYINNLFSNIAPRYDIANDVLSMGLHKRWKRYLVQQVLKQNPMSILDCATGTGDITLMCESKVSQTIDIVGVDFCERMIDVARQRLPKTSSIEYHVCDIMSMPFDDNTFDVITISFGIRNVAEPLRVLKEMVRTAKSGGTIFILEFGLPKGIWFLPYMIYRSLILPFMGWLTSRNWQAYKYLSTSIAQFPSGNDFLKLTEKTEYFSERNSYQLMGGICYLYKLKIK